jgi:hypothetical protein
MFGERGEWLGKFSSSLVVVIGFEGGFGEGDLERS